MHRIEDVTARDMCIGCGGCSVVTSGAVSVSLGRFGTYEADLSGASEDQRRAASGVCPFSDEAPDEAEVAASTFGGAMPIDDFTGAHLGVYAGRVRDAAYLEGSSSGGLTSWLIQRLLEDGLVDGVIHVGASERDASGDPLFGYVLSTDAKEAAGRRKSIYSATSMAEVLAEVRGDGRRYALVGVPCFIRAARLISRKDPVGEQLRYFVGLVCGHMKSTRYAEALAWQVGVAPDELAAADFRVKDDDRVASDYSFAAQDGEGTARRARSATLVGTNWGHGMFHVNACNYCDDVFAETADIVFGDAWLPQYVSDASGTNVVVTRRRELDDILKRGRADGAITLDDLGIGDVRASQSGNYRHRREGLAARLADDRRAGLSAPRKRVAPSYGSLPPARLRLLRLRREMGLRSHELFAAARESGDLTVFTDGMAPLVRRYARIEKGSVPRRVWRRLRALARRGG